MAVTAGIYGVLVTVVNLYGLGQIPPWIMPPLGGGHDAFVAAGPNLILLAAILLLGPAITGRRRAGSARLTTQGANALDQELATLRALVTRLDRTPGPGAGPAHRTQPTQT